MTRALVLYAHPCEESFGAALHTCVVDTLRGRGWDVDDCDLYAEDFAPVLTAAERRDYHDTATNAAPVQSYVDRLRAADTLVFVHPVWNFGFPAILKGFLDRVFLPGVSFRLDDGRVKPNLTNIRRLAAVATYGGPRHRAFLMGDPPRRLMGRVLRGVTLAPTYRYLALYDMNRATDADRARFLGKVTDGMRAL